MKVFIPNFRQIGFLIAAAAAILLAVTVLVPSDGWADGETAEKIIVSAFAALLGCALFFGSLLLLPCGFVFDKKGVTIYYLFFLRKEYGEWQEINRITVEQDVVDHKTYFFPWDYVFPARNYKIHELEGDRLFFMKGEIPKNILTKHYITKFRSGALAANKPKKKRKKSSRRNK